MSIQYLVVEFKPTAVGTTRPGLPPKHNKVRLRLNLFMTLPPDFKGGEDFIKYETKRERERSKGPFPGSYLNIFVATWISNNNRNNNRLRELWRGAEKILSDVGGSIRTFMIFVVAIGDRREQFDKELKRQQIIFYDIFSVKIIFDKNFNKQKRTSLIHLKKDSPDCHFVIKSFWKCLLKLNISQSSASTYVSILN